MKKIVHEEHDRGALSSAVAPRDPMTAIRNQDRMAKVRRSQIHWLDEVK